MGEDRSRQPPELTWEMARGVAAHFERVMASSFLEVLHEKAMGRAPG